MRRLALLLAGLSACAGDPMVNGEACQTSADCLDGWACHLDEDDPLRTDRHGYFCTQLCGLGRDPCPASRKCDDGICVVGDGTPAIDIFADTCVAGTRCLVQVNVGPGSGQVDDIEIDYGDGGGETFPPDSPARQHDGVWIVIHVEHVFAAAGRYQLSAVAHDANGLDGTDEYEVEIRAPL